MNAEPASSIVEIMGGAMKVAAITGRHYSRVYRWTYSVERGGTGGIIPAREQVKLLAYAKKSGADLRPEDFFSSARIQAELAMRRQEVTE